MRKAILKTVLLAGKPELQNTSKLKITNNKNGEKLFLFTKPIKLQSTSFSLNSQFTGDNVDKCTFIVLNSKFKKINELPSNTYTISDTSEKKIYIAIRVPGRSNLMISDLSVTNCTSKEGYVYKQLTRKTIILLPELPEYGDNYLQSYSSRLQALNGDACMVVMHNEDGLNTYVKHIDNIDILVTGYNDIRIHLQNKKYDKILCLYFNERLIQLLDASDLSSTTVFIYPGVRDTLYKNSHILERKYFQIAPTHADTNNTLNKSIQKYSELPNVKWVFESTRHLDLSRDSHPSCFNNHQILVPFAKCEDISDKMTSQNKTSILIAGVFDNHYHKGIDVAVRSVMELSKKDCFKNIDITIAGIGDFFDELTQPMKDFSNVRVVTASAEQTRDIALKSDIAIYPERYIVDAHLVTDFVATHTTIVGFQHIGIEQFTGSDGVVLCEDGDFTQIAHEIECLVNNRKKLDHIRNAATRHAKNSASFDKTIRLEASILNEDTSLALPNFRCNKADEKPVLTVAIPSYNVGRFLINSVFSLINHPLNSKLEILIINDGSKDNTSEIGKHLEAICNPKGRPIVRLIDKENGGHGSTINVGIKEATGKYFRLMDGDDYFVADEFAKQIELLEHEEADIVLTNYIEDFAVLSVKKPVHFYDFMEPRRLYDTTFMHYKRYGFGQWGPLLPSTTCKTSILKNSGFLIDEHCFYVDMEYNFLIYSKAKTVVYYPLDIYNYYLGRVGQSMSKDSVKKNYLDHEKVTLRLIQELQERKDDIEENKQTYLTNTLIIPFVKAQYMIGTEYFDNPDAFLSFDNKLQKYPHLYNHPDIVGKMITLHRKTNGRLIFAHNNIRAIKNLMSRIRGKNT